MRQLYLTILAMMLIVSQQAFAASAIGLKFNRTGTDASSVAITVVDENGTAIEGATATVAASHSFKSTSNAVSAAILCPNINGNTGQTIELTFTINGVPAGFTFDKVGLDIHALNGGSNYQEPSDGVTRQWNVTTTVNNITFGSLSDIDIAANVGSSGDVHKVWEITGATVNADGTMTVKLTITKGTTNAGCFFGLSEVKLSTNGEEPEPEPEPEPDPEPTPDGDYKVYCIQWKNTGTNYITEESDHRMTVQSQDNTKPQFWMFIPTENENCYYIKNTATGRYMGSCNLTPSSASKISTSTTPVEYYVGTSSVKSGLSYFSSTDCADYDNESAGPRALNKDGASDYVITWMTRQNGTYDDGSYWKLVETEDLYEVRPFDGSTAIGKIGASYNIESINGKNLTIAEGTLALVDPDAFDENQEWYFVGTGNATGWQIASAAEPAIVVGIADGNIKTGEGLTTKWKVNASKEKNGYFYFTSEGTTLKVEDDSLFRFSRLRSAYMRKLKVYNNPCGTAGTNYVKKFELNGEAALSNIIYEAQSKPAKWHVVYAQDKGEVAQGGTFNLDVTLSSSAASSLVVAAHFDWNSDGVFETEAPLTVNGTAATAEVTVPDWATMEQTRMRLRVNSNGLDLAEDEVNGFIYDFHIKVVEPQDARTVTVGVNSWERGKAELSNTAESYAYGTTVTATATAYGNGTFVCWKEEGVVVSTSAEYTFTVDHNVKLVAYFAPNTDESSYPTGIQETTAGNSIGISVTDNAIVATGDVTGMELYTVNAALIAKTRGDAISTNGIKEGVYIVRATTANGYKNVKIFIKK
ncbi:MAG: hypothetical protein IKJ49_06765 [Bacteroidaceae bacterium]|nr:hypothetical protein [Bacteroidaceae bacterium]